MQRQLMLKILAIVVVGLSILIPINMVKYKLHERQGYLQQAKSSVASSWTGKQFIISPVLVVPYQTNKLASKSFYTSDGQQLIATPETQQQLLILPDTQEGELSISNEYLTKGIYQVPIYSGSVSFDGVFSAEKLREALSTLRTKSQIESIGEPYVAMHISDMRGMSKNPELTVNNNVHSLVPGTGFSALASGLRSESIAKDHLNEELAFSFKVWIRGMESLSFLSLAEEASTKLESDWPHPEFIGNSLPDTREISQQGFSAHWLSSRYSNNGLEALHECNDKSQCHNVLASSSGVSFIDPVDIYLQSERSIKYAVLFIGLSFITFFIFECITLHRIHPIQYAFVGLAISTFYLLLISLAEHIEFYLAYLIAVGGCSGLISFYVRYMLRSIRSSILFSAMLTGLYGLLYVIVQAEDFALLMGAVLVFMILAILMYVTRGIDWYNLTSDPSEAHRVQ
jgi:inner membrane protein